MLKKIVVSLQAQALETWLLYVLLETRSINQTV